ncbi:MAG: excisionase family DNA-binding protein [Lutibacter sp.]|nr:excisionase family DNA-binding protein [Lutibacter sp.]
MSSNMMIPKTCSYCGKAFVAKTTLTRYCCHKCNSRHYKQKIKDEKIQKSLIEQQSLQTLQTLQKNNPNSLISKSYLCVKEAAELIGVSRWTINRMIKRGDLQIHKFGRKKIIQRSQIDNLFN